MILRLMTPAGGDGQLQAQEFLDGISDLDFNTKTRDWYTVDVSTMIQDIDIIDHEIDDVTGCSLLFLRNSVIHCCPDSQRIKHYPKHLIHCFVENRSGRKPISKNSNTSQEPVFFAELFSISPCEEQLNWSVGSHLEGEVPRLQALTARWLRYLNS